MMRKVFILSVPLLIIVFLGFTIGNSQQVKESSIPLHTDTANYPLLSRRIFIDNPNDSLVNFSELRRQLVDHVNNSGIEGSIYFEYLPTGTSVGIDAEEQEVAASLIKLPAAMELYKAAELGKVDLDSKVALQKSWLNTSYGSLYKKGEGYELTLREATKIMLEQSDNTALQAIGYSTAGKLEQAEQPFNSLDVDIVQNTDLTVSISARSYASILKCLYFSCYLDKKDSQEILEYLSNTIYTQRLQAGIKDKDITVAHKTGNFAQNTQSDCGIVYIPKRNYLLCIMINTADNAEGDAKISRISKIVYDFMDSLPE